MLIDSLQVLVDLESLASPFLLMLNVCKRCIWQMLILISTLQDLLFFFLLLRQNSCYYAQVLGSHVLTFVRKLHQSVF